MLLFICNRLQSLSSAVCLPKTAVHVFCCSFAKDCSPCLLLSLFFAIKNWAPPSFSAIHLQRTAVLVFRLSFAKDSRHCFRFLFAKNCSLCFLLYVCKGLQSLSFAIHLQRSALRPLSSATRLQRSVVLVSGFRLQRTDVFVSTFVCKGLRSLFSAISLQKPAVHVFQFPFAKNCCPCFRLFQTKVCKGLLPCFLLFVCKGLLSKFSALCSVFFAIDYCSYFLLFVCKLLLFLFFRLSVRRGLLPSLSAFGLENMLKSYI